MKNKNSLIVKILTHKYTKILAFIIIAAITGFLGFLLDQAGQAKQWVSPPMEPPAESGIKAALHFYGKDVKKLSQKYDLSYPYLMALIMVETSGKRNPRPRFEPHIYKKLKEVRDGKRDKFENITQKDLQGMSDHQLRQLAKSWGPFQIMGYKSLQLGISVKDLHNKNALENGIRWINQEYGDLIRQGRYRDAFHYHNTGHVLPRNGRSKTTDPYYIEKGMQYMKIFQELDKMQKTQK